MPIPWPLDAFQLRFPTASPHHVHGNRSSLKTHCPPCTMDPASIIGLTSAIVSLIEATTKIISYVNDIKSAPTERAQFARHASSLLALLTDLRYRVEESASHSAPWFASLRGLGVEGGPLDQLHQQMGRLATKLEPSSGRLEKIGNALKWTIDKKDTEETLVQIERVKSLVMVALQNDQLYGSHFIPLTW